MNCSNCKHGKWIDINESVIICTISTKEMAYDECCGNHEPVDNVNHPSHYTQGKYEVIDVIEDWKLCYHLGSSVKYIARAEHKGKQIEDLKKARWFLDRKIEKLEKGEDVE